MFELFRISMVQRQQIDMAEYRLSDGRVPSREEWLRLIFSKKIEFSNRGQRFYFTPIQPPDGTDAIAGRIGRLTAKVENQSPDEGFEPIERPGWQASDVFIDPTHHDDGQQLAMEIKASVGSATGILQGMAAHLNKRGFQSPYFIDIGPISDPQTFWDFVHANKGNVISVTFEAPVPNMFGHKNDHDEEMRRYRDEEKARVVAISLKSTDGLQLSTQGIQDAVDYAAKVGGNITAKARKKRSYSSKKKIRRITSEDIKNGENSKNSRIIEILKTSLRSILMK